MTKPLPRILLVDDEPNNLLLLEELLHSQGYETLVASSGSQALEIVQDFLPDLILLDVMMPEMGGFEVCRRLREDPNLQTVPIIFLTALNDEDSRLTGLEMMGDDYFTKPIKSNLLIKKISSTLRLNKMRSQHQERKIEEQVKEKIKGQISAAWEINQYLSEKLRLFVPDQFLRRIAPKGVESIQLGNARQEELTVLFCDIRGFTSITESQRVNETFEWLNAFYTQMNSAIATNHGFIDKFLGDAIMAVFDRAGNHSQDALTAAVMMIHSLNKFNGNREQYNLNEPLRIGIGIHTGTAMIGTVGSDHRMDSTVIGDVVNTAARLEELTKVYNCEILASDAVIAQLSQPELFRCRWIDRAIPRGKKQGIDLYEVFGTQTPVLDEAKLLY
ncbi:response regulator [Cyanobacteria bacterium FACHB-472]|nr:response regulator [Cyanobacteria bacterium FACHB-472]